MSAENPPTFSFNGIDFNPTYYINESTSSGFTQEQANDLYLQKKIPDTATALETFTGGVKTNSIENVLTTDISNILINSTGNINIGTSASRTTANPIIIGNATNSIIRLGSTGLSFTTSGTPTATLQAILTSGIFVQTPTAAFNFLNNQTGTLTIGTANNRTGDISIASTQTTGTGNIVLGSTALTTGTQNITINRPLTIGYTQPATSVFTNLGAYSNTTDVSASITGNGTFIRLVTLPTLPDGVYAVTYQIAYTIGSGALPISFTTQRFGISTSSTLGIYGTGMGQHIVGTYIKPRTLNYVESYSFIFRLSGVYYLGCDSTFADNTLTAIGNVVITRIG